MTELKLRNCPFCGGKAKLRITSEICHGFDGGQVKIDGWKVACQNCGIETSLENRETAVEKWNRRADNV